MELDAFLRDTEKGALEKETTVKLKGLDIGMGIAGLGGLGGGIALIESIYQTRMITPGTESALSPEGALVGLGTVSVLMGYKLIGDAIGYDLPR